MMTTSEKATQKSITLPLLSCTTIELLVWALCQELVLSTTQHYPALRCLKWGWFPLLRDLG